MSLISRVSEPITDLFRLVFPVYCENCGETLHKGEECLCSFCEYQLPQTHFHLQTDNPVETIFWGRIPVFAAATFLHYQKGEMVQQLIHQLKYHGKGHIGVYLGRLFGQQLMQSQRFNDVNVIIPVPLHWKKKKLRGYNQSEKIAEGLEKSMNAVKDTQSLLRVTHSSTQTKKTRYERWENVKSIFQLSPESSKLENQHVLLVDDVITTGSTIESCFLKLTEINGIRISIVSLACPSI
ncbi:MAG: ComF family protein [Bacteroidales bacterium]|nr:ComF family protein [Bacteroidales bacterium]MCF8326880.1 ComF family protein [Bacteroidales bacterium]